MSMSDGVEAHNLLPDPKPVATAKWVVPSGRDVRVQMLDRNRLHLTNNVDNADSYAYTQVALPADTYRFGVEVSDPQGAPPVDWIGHLADRHHLELEVAA